MGTKVRTFLFVLFIIVVLAGAAMRVAAKEPGYADSTQHVSFPVFNVHNEQIDLLYMDPDKPGVIRSQFSQRTVLAAPYQIANFLVVISVNDLNAGVVEWRLIVFDTKGVERVYAMGARYTDLYNDGTGDLIFGGMVLIDPHPLKPAAAKQ